jgi:hypothetical protein
MQPVSIFSLDKHEGPYEKWPGQTRLFVCGQYSGKSVPGFVVEAQYRCSAGYLLILSQDCPFEESNDFVLLDHAFNTIAQSGLGVMYESFLIEKHWPLSDTALVLDYGNDLRYVLSIEPRFLNRLKLTVERC